MPAYIKTVKIPKPLSEIEEELTVIYKAPDILFGIEARIISVQQDGKKLERRYDFSEQGLEDYVDLWDRIEAAILEIELG